jgi:serine/threonine protein kinase/beta-lactam-binding protein with PASTA domain
VQTAAPDSLVGRTLEGRYRILNRIARGGMSTVYEAVDERLDRLVAVKVMSAALSADPAFSDRFSREARAAARLTHVNAVAVYDQGFDEIDGHHVFLVMELVEGRTLRDLIRERNGRFTPAEAVSIMEPVLAALAAAHRAGLVHRDVKPENILLSDDGLVKVADFGLARAIDSDAASTRTGLMMGTVAYCAPEQIVKGLADQRSDVYAAGIVLFELLTGRPPYQGESAMNVAYQHVHSRVPAPSSVVQGIPAEIDELVVAATDSDPAGRPTDAAMFLAEIAEVRLDLALPVMPIPPRPRQPRAPVGPPPAHAADAGAPAVRPMSHDTSRTDVLGAHAPGQYDTQVVPRGGPAAPLGAGPRGLAPGSVPPPAKGKRKPLTAKARRRRRTWIGLAVVVLLGLAAAIGGMKAVDWYHDWNTHVPKIVGESGPQAQLDLRKLGYQPVLGTPQFSETVATGDVISTDPTPGTRLQKGKTITLVLSRGKNRVDVPSVIKQPVSDAQATLQAHGLKFAPNPLDKSSITVPKGDVISTSPAAGEPVKPGTIVTLTVSSGPPIVDIPANLVGMTYDDAQTALTQLHLKASRKDVYSDSVTSGTVISLSPQTKATYGTTVTVTVSKGPQYVTIPSFPDLDTVADVRQQLQQLGLVVRVEKAFGGHTGRVVGIDPGQGKQVQVGSTVTLTIV